MLNTSASAYPEPSSSYTYSQPESLAAPEFEESLNDPYPNSSLPTTTTASFDPYLQTPAAFETSSYGSADNHTTTEISPGQQYYLPATVAPSGHASGL